jgi:hypothetical protein
LITCSSCCDIDTDLKSDTYESTHTNNFQTFEKNILQPTNTIYKSNNNENITNSDGSIAARLSSLSCTCRCLYPRSSIYRSLVSTHSYFRLSSFADYEGWEFESAQAKQRLTTKQYIETGNMYNIFLFLCFISWKFST